MSGSFELIAAFLMIYFNHVETALKVNAALALIGPTVMILVTSLGILGLDGNVSLAKMLFILSGVALIFIGLNKF